MCWWEAAVNKILLIVLRFKKRVKPEGFGLFCFLSYVVNISWNVGFTLADSFPSAQKQCVLINKICHPPADLWIQLLREAVGWN